MKTYIILDLEWNQSPDGKIGSIKNIPFEIIEIGAIKLDENFNIISEFNKIIKPKIYKKMHFKVTEILHIGIQELKKRGEPFSTVIQDFFSWAIKENEKTTFCTWGNMDLTELQRNIAYYNLENPFSTPLLFYDVQKLYSLSKNNIEEKINRYPLEKACEELNIVTDRVFHHALDDAFYTAMVFKNLNFNKLEKYISLDYYTPPLTKDDEIYLLFPDYSKYVSTTFKLKEDIFKNKTVSDIICYKCNRMLKKKIPWFSSNQKIYYSLAKCPEHSYIKAKIKIKSTDNDNLFAIKTIKLIDSEEAKLLSQKKEETKRKRKEKNKANKYSKRQK